MYITEAERFVSERKCSVHRVDLLTLSSCLARRVCESPIGNFFWHGNQFHYHRRPSTQKIKLGEQCTVCTTGCMYLEGNIIACMLKAIFLFGTHIYQRSLMSWEIMDFSFPWPLINMVHQYPYLLALLYLRTCLLLSAGIPKMV